MAFSVPSESPAIIVKEVDLSGYVPNVQSTTGAYVGNFRWGPVEEATLVSTEAGLVSLFGAPSTDEATDFISAAYFLKYSSSLQIVRAVNASAVNAYDADAASAPLVKNLQNFTNQDATLADSDHTFIARYPGELGNSISVSVCPYSATNSTFDNWTYTGSFDAAPNTSDFAASVSATHDEVHVAVIDRLGVFSGTRGTVLETFSYVSLGSNAKTSNGTSNYIKDVVNNGSRYVWMSGFGTNKFNDAAGTAADTNVDFGDDNNYSAAALDVTLAAGVNSGTLGTSEVLTGFDHFEDKDTIQVDFLIAPGMAARIDQTTIVNDLITTAQSLRKDCIVISSPARSDIINNSAPVTSTVATVNTFTNSSYLVVDNNYIKVYDKYNDRYVYIPAASSTAGIMAATDLNAAPWYSPAGARRGQYLGITALSYSPTKAERDTLYKAGINPIANLPGQGVLLFGDKTKLNRPSAFDRINVRRLFIVLERAIALAARNTMFEFNDEFTRAEFVSIVEPFLREVQGRRGITDFRVVCDETNNPGSVIDRNEFVANIFIKPARSINYITLNFVAVRTGVDFEEIAGLAV
jgi:hypothetical protein